MQNLSQKELKHIAKNRNINDYKIMTKDKLIIIIILIIITEIEKAFLNQKKVFISQQERIISNQK